jgi:hypothetical protein
MSGGGEADLEQLEHDLAQFASCLQQIVQVDNKRYKQCVNARDMEKTWQVRRPPDPKFSALEGRVQLVLCICASDHTACSMQDN